MTADATKMSYQEWIREFQQLLVELKTINAQYLACEDLGKRRLIEQKKQHIGEACAHHIGDRYGRKTFYGIFCRWVYDGVVSKKHLPAAQQWYASISSKGDWCGNPKFRRLLQGSKDFGVDVPEHNFGLTATFSINALKDWQISAALEALEGKLDRFKQSPAQKLTNPSL